MSFGGVNRIMDYYSIVSNVLDENEIIEFLKSLINTRSDYPPGDTRKIAELCANKLSDNDISCSIRVPDSSVRNPKDNNPSFMYPSVIAELGNGNGPTLLFNAHIDTVSSGDHSMWATDPFLAFQAYGNIYGRGAGDDKGSVCAQIMAAILLRRAGVPINGKLIINPVSDEEANSCRGAKWLIESNQLLPDMVIVGEQTNNRIAVAERAVVFVRITITGKACHGAMPWVGSNATVHMSDFIQAIKKEVIPQMESVKHPYLPLTTISPTHIDGGIQVNIIPEKCALELDCRLTPGVSEVELLDSFDRILRRLSHNKEQYQYEIEVTNSEKGVVTDTKIDSELVVSISEAYEKVMGKWPEYTGYMQASDGRVFARRQIPIVIFGPGDPKLGHSPNEFVPVSQVIEATKILAFTAIKLLAK